MISKESQPQDELQRREAELKQREQSLRLREIENELLQQRDPEVDVVVQTVRLRPHQTTLSRWRRKASIGIKLFAILVVAVVGIKLGTWLAIGVVLGGVGWLTYKAFFAGDIQE
ncbi:MAG: hypothetical protein ACFCU9_12010 [Cyanophyceae cyanobacterium]